MGASASVIDGLQRLRDLRGGMSRQARGQAFERWLVTLMNEQRLHARGSYRPQGEEIDGSFVLDRRVVLFEAKWTSAPLPASSIYAFKAKVDGKLTGTVGVYISMAGYGPDAVEALQKGKDLNVVLVDGADLDVALEEGIRAVLRKKLRAAAELGVVWYPVSATRVRTTGSEIAPRAADGGGDASVSTTATWSNKLHPVEDASTAPVVVFVESAADAAVVGGLTEKVLRKLAAPEALEVEMIVTGGATSLALTLRRIGLRRPTTWILLLDTEFEDPDVKISEAVEELAGIGQAHIIPVNPTVASGWVGTEPLADRDLTTYIDAVDRVDLDDLVLRERSFRQFFEILRNEIGLWRQRHPNLA